MAKTALTPPPLAPPLVPSFQTTSPPIGARGGLEPGAAAAERERTRGGEIHMIAAVRDPVAGAVVARGNAYRDAHRRGRLKGLVHCRHRLRSPARFRPAPTDGNHRGLMGRVVNRGGDGIEKARVGVGRESTPRCVACGTIAPTTSISSITSPSGPFASPVGVFCAWSTDTAVTGGRSHAESLEIGVQVRGAKPAAQFNQRHALASAAAGGKAV